MTVISSAYLGKSGAMRVLPAPRKDFAGTISRGDAVHGLIGGGTTVVRVLNPKRSWTLPYDVDASTADVLLGFYQGLYGAGPWRFVDPTARNMLPLDQSVCGGRLQAASGWAVSAGGLTAAATGTGPAGVDSGVLTWSTLTAAATMFPGSQFFLTCDINTAPVYLPGEAVTVSLWAKASSSTTTTLRLAGCNSAGTITVTSATTSMALTTAWQRFTVTIAAGNGSYAAVLYVIPQILLGGTVPTSVSVAGVQVEYADAVSAFQPGFGCPRVVLTDAPGRSIPAAGYRAHTLTLAEV